MINLEIVWAIASLIIGASIFYFAHTGGFKDPMKTWAALFSGFLFSLGLISILFLTGRLCGECQRYCKAPGCKGNFGTQNVYKFPMKRDTMEQ